MSRTKKALLPPSTPFPAEQLEPVFSSSNPQGLPRAAYTDPAVFAYEQERLFRRSWLAVARECELTGPGDFLRAQVAGEELLLVRGVDLGLRAFYNVCRHRGLRLVEAERGKLPQLSCAYHGWTYELSGALRLAPYMPPGFQKDCHGLAQARVDVLHGFVFVCLDTDAAPLQTALAGAPEWLTRSELNHLRLGRKVSHDVNANWKLLVENFQESHHFQRVHPALEQQTPSARATTFQGEGAWLGGCMELAPGLSTVTTPGATTERPFIVPEQERHRVADAMAFPLLLTSVQPDYLLSYQLEPLDALHTRVTANTYFHAAAFAPELDAADVFAFWDGVNAEDRAICERQQGGLASLSFSRASYSLLEEGVAAFDRLLARWYLEAAP